MCADCEAIEHGKRGAPGHARLVQEGQPMRGPTPIGQAKITITHYRCKACGRRWQYVNDKNADGAGWTPVGV